MSAAISAASAAIDAVHKAFGAPGDYGYDTPKGDALMALYRSQIGLDETGDDPVSAMEAVAVDAKLIAAAPDLLEALKAVLRKVEWWAQQKCPCHNDLPNPCPLCGASVENLETCKAVESVFPRDLLADIRGAIAS